MVQFSCRFAFFINFSSFKPTEKLKRANAILGYFEYYLPNVIKSDRYNFELHRFKVGVFFLRHSVVSVLMLGIGIARGQWVNGYWILGALLGISLTLIIALNTQQKNNNECAMDQELYTELLVDEVGTRQMLNVHSIFRVKQRHDWE